MVCSVALHLHLAEQELSDKQDLDLPDFHGS